MGAVLGKYRFIMSEPSNPVVLHYSERKVISEDTIARSQAIVQAHAAEGATLDSSFLTLDKMPRMERSACPNFPPSEIKVVNLDSFTVARDIMRESPDARGKTTVLNLASDARRAGGWVQSLSKTQEEALCYSSTLYATLEPKYYPWPNVGPGSAAGIYSPGVVIFKDDLDHGCAELQPSDRRVVSVITVAAPRHRALTEDSSTFKNPSF
ncbi:hypothetical protein D9615_003807 [Tricholomella constricta]|uniref:Microbial-type PARG catalytic domain-containing protein n=1 Tax=Tricholomella constricta TaxID=117010 RepID=A0A8H5HHT9_9AGAR|nr:hypothetical protein D9615_003807 [Tricholomella constricta]